MTMTGKDLIKKLQKNGWTIDRINGSHHVLTKYGYKPVAIPAHAGKDLPNGTLNKLLKDTGLKG